MGIFNISIINHNISILNITEPDNSFGIYPVSPSISRLGLFKNPLFEIEIILSEERIVIETLANGQHISNSLISLSPDISEWFSGTCCTDFSIFNYLPAGEYRLIKTGLKPVYNKSILLGNEWSSTSQNILCFEGSGTNEIITSGKLKKNTWFPFLYSIIFGADEQTTPSLNMPLPGVIINDYELIHKGTAGIIFFSFNNNKPYNPENFYTQEIVLIIPYQKNFILTPFSNKNTVLDNIDQFINDFTEAIT